MIASIPVFCLLLAALAGTGFAQNYHAPEYLTGGAWAAVPNPPEYIPGLFVVKSDGSYRTVARQPYFAVAYCMDVDNKHFVAQIADASFQSNKSGIAGLYRFDPNTMAQTTIYGPDTVNFSLPQHLHLNQDGDYVLGAYIPAPSARHYRILKVSRSGTLTTLLTSLRFGRPVLFTGYIDRNIDNGKLLLCASMQQVTSYFFTVLELAPDGTVTSFHSGPGAWPGSGYHCSQNVLNGHIEGPSLSHFYQLKRGSGWPTTLATLRVGSQTAQRVVNGRFDLQTAPKARWVSTPGSRAVVGTNQWVAYVARDGVVTSIRVQTGTRAIGSCYDAVFFRGRHLQTLKVGPNRWDILISCPRSPGYPYVLAASLSGVRPGVALADGRRINLVVDALTSLTLGNRLPGTFHPGALTLDATGGARGFLDLSGLKPPPGGFGIPLWIALAVLDPRAPTGIKYLPDTYVMRI